MIDIFTTKFVVYGINSLKKKKFREIKNIKHFCKPEGGLWASPINSTHGWREWCLRENFDTKDLETYCKFKLKRSSNIYIINSFEDLLNIPFKITDSFSLLSSTFKNEYIDFEKMKKNGWDGIFLSHIGELLTRNKRVGYNIDLYGWDVESLLLFNFDCIIPIPLQKRIRVNKDYKKKTIIIRTMKNLEVDGIHKENYIWKYDEERLPSVSITKGHIFGSRKAFIKEAIRLQNLIADDPTAKFMIK